MDKIVIKNIGSNEITVVKDIRDLLNTDLNQAKDIVDRVKLGHEIELDVKDARFAYDILSSDGATVCIKSDLATDNNINSRVDSFENKENDNVNKNVNNENMTSYKRESEQKICSLFNQNYKKRDAFFTQGIVLFILWIMYVFIDSFYANHNNIYEEHNWIRMAYIHLNSKVLVAGTICLVVEIVGFILGILSSSYITLTDNKVYGKSSFIYRFNYSLGEIREVKFIDKFNTLEIQIGDTSTKLLFMKSGAQIKEKIDDAIYRYNNLDGRYQESKFSDEKGEPIWKLILGGIWNLFLIYLLYSFLFAVPDVNGKNIKEAEKILTRRGIEYTKQAEFPTFTTYNKGDVSNDGGKAHLPIVSVDSIVLTYIGGVTEEQLNSLPGKTLEEAYSILSEAGCALYYNETYSESVPEGCIISWGNNPDDYCGSSYVVTISLGKEPKKNNNYGAGNQFPTGAGSKENNTQWDVKIVANREEDNFESEYNGISAYFSWYFHLICEFNNSDAKATLKYVITSAYGYEYEDTIEDVQGGQNWNIFIPENTFDCGDDVTIAVYINGKKISSYDMWISYN